MASITATNFDGCTLIEFSSPLLAMETLAELADHLARIARDARPLPVVLVSTHPRIFLAGADLQEIASLDADSSASYAGLGRATLTALTRHPSPTVAAVGGSCSGGGFDLVLACDALVAAPGTTFAHPGVSRGLVTGWGGTTVLPHRLGRTVSSRVMLEARTFTAEQLLEAGAVTDIDENVERCARETAKRLTALHPARLALWRAVRNGDHKVPTRRLKREV